MKNNQTTDRVKNSKSGRERRTIGLLPENLGHYYFTIKSGVVEIAREHDVNLFTLKYGGKR